MYYLRAELNIISYSSLPKTNSNMATQLPQKLKEIVKKNFLSAITSAVLKIHATVIIDKILSKYFFILQQFGVLRNFFLMVDCEQSNYYQQYFNFCYKPIQIEILL